MFAAFLFVFIPTVGEFVTPSLVGGTSGYLYGNQIVDLFGTGFPDWRQGSVLALFLLAIVAVLAARVLAVPPAAEAGGVVVDMALSRRGAWVLRAFFIALIAFLYLPILLLLVFSFNDSLIPSFPLSGFTLHWYGVFIHDGELRGTLETSALVAALSSLGAVFLGLWRRSPWCAGASAGRRW